MRRRTEARDRDGRTYLVPRPQREDGYGREPGPDDPIFVDVPSDDEYDAMVTKAMEQAGVVPEVIYAFRKTGRIITEENAKFVPAAALEAWHQAIAEYETLMEDQETEPQ